MSTEDLENYEADRELQLAQEYQDVAGMFRYAVETERRFYLANEVAGERRSATAPARWSRSSSRDAWVWDMYRRSRFVPQRAGGDVQGRERRGAPPPEV